MESKLCHTKTEYANKQKKTYFLHPTGRQPPKHLKNITSAVYGLAQGICSFVGSNILADRNVAMVCCLCVQMHSTYNRSFFFLC